MFVSIWLYGCLSDGWPLPSLQTISMFKLPCLVPNGSWFNQVFTLQRKSEPPVTKALNINYVHNEMCLTTSHFKF